MNPKVMTALLSQLKWHIIQKVFVIDPTLFLGGRASLAALERREAGEDGNRPGDAEAGGPPAGPPAAGQRRSPQPAAPQQK